MGEAAIIIISVAFTLAFIGIAVWVVIRGRTLTYATHFIADKNHPILHILGNERVMPDEGESYDVYKHYVFSLVTQKFELLGKQHGTELNLESEFVKRCLKKFEDKYHEKLEFGTEATNNGFSFIGEKGPIEFSLHHVNYMDSDTGIPVQPENNCLVFKKYTERGFGKFTVTLRKSGREIKTHTLNGDAQFYFKGFCDAKKRRLYFTYGKQRGIKFGMGLCILQYETGELVFEGWVR